MNTRAGDALMTNDFVREGYDRAAERYLSTRDRFANEAQLALLTDRLPAGASVLDVGCGAGVPLDQSLVRQGYQVTGIDISPRQITLARQNVPQASYRVGDFSLLCEAEYQVDAVISFYAIFHTKRETHQQTFERFFSFLPAGGLLLVTMGTSDSEGTEPDFHRVPMFWSQYGARQNRRLIERAGFTVLHDAIDETGGERHQILLGQKRAVTVRGGGDRVGRAVYRPSG